MDVFFNFTLARESHRGSWLWDPARIWRRYHDHVVPKLDSTQPRRDFLSAWRALDLVSGHYQPETRTLIILLSVSFFYSIDHLHFPNEISFLSFHFKVQEWHFMNFTLLTSAAKYCPVAKCLNRKRLFQWPAPPLQGSCCTTYQSHKFQFIKHFFKLWSQTDLSV